MLILKCKMLRKRAEKFIFEKHSVELINNLASSMMGMFSILSVRSLNFTLSLPTSYLYLLSYHEN